jgi:hypothetical protein
MLYLPNKTGRHTRWPEESLNLVQFWKAVSSYHVLQ